MVDVDFELCYCQLSWVSIGLIVIPTPYQEWSSIRVPNFKRFSWPEAVAPDSQRSGENVPSVCLALAQTP